MQLIVNVKNRRTKQKELSNGHQDPCRYLMIFAYNQRGKSKGRGHKERCPCENLFVSANAAHHSSPPSRILSDAPGMAEPA